MRRMAPTAIKVGILGIIVFFILRNIPLKLSEIGSFLEHASIAFYSSMFVFAFFLMLQASIWVMIVNAASEQAIRTQGSAKLGLLEGVRIFIDSQFAKYIPGGIWNYAGRVMLASRAGVALDAQVSSIVYENVLLMSAAFVYALILLVSLGKVPAVSIAGVLAIFLAAYLGYNKVLRLIRLSFAKVSDWRIARRFISKAASAIGAGQGFGGTEAVLSRNRFFGFLACFLGSHIFMGIAFWMLTNSFGRGSISIYFAAGTFATSWLLGLFSPLPGGLGVREGFLVYFLSIKLGTETAIYISVIARVWNMMAEVLLWAIVRAVSHLTRRVKTYDEA